MTFRQIFRFLRVCELTLFLYDFTGTLAQESRQPLGPEKSCDCYFPLNNCVCVRACAKNVKANTYAWYSGFGGLEVACWLLVPKFAASNPIEAVGFFPQHSFLRKACRGIFRRFTARKRSLNVTWKSGIFRLNSSAISRPSSSSFHY